MQQQVVEKRELTREEEIALSNKRTGLTIFQISWIMAFVCLVLVNLQLRNSYPSWPPPDVEPMSPILPTIATFGLIVSCLFARGGLKAVEANDTARFLSQWRVTIGLGAAFLAMMVFEFLIVPAEALATQYGMIFRVMTAFHGVHALVIALMMAQFYRNGQTGIYNTDNSWAIEGTAKLWYFVAVAWIMFYIVLYWL